MLTNTGKRGKRRDSYFQSLALLVVTYRLTYRRAQPYLQPLTHLHGWWCRDQKQKAPSDLFRFYFLNDLDNRARTASTE